jgi:CBS domain-containing protein
MRRALALVQADLEAGGHGRPPVAFSWLVAGSEGRREQTLKTDQDNGLVYQDPPPGAEAGVAGYFERLATAMGETLARLGFPRCPGDFMAANPRWRQPERIWRRYFDSWMETPQPEPVLQASLFFDLRPVGGDEGIGRRLWDWVCETAPTRSLFLRYMARVAVDRPRPLGLFGGFAVERTGPHKDRLDLKATAVLPVTHGLRLRHQLACLDAGLPPDNFIRPRALGRTDRLLLKEAFRTIGSLERGIADRFQTGLVVG